ncbi:MAG: PCYCGC motif-containing (lipo)protein [Dehalococcoidia bacterium]|nr:PCYCGC motif-containing (lipo)protein [Dehalococcoidia bacterium]
MSIRETNFNRARGFVRWRLAKVSLLNLSLAAALLVAGVGASACEEEAHSSAGSGRMSGPYTKNDVSRNSQVKFPTYVSSKVRDAYEFALANPDKLQYMPCYCGCGLEEKHGSNLNCYVSGVDQAGAVVFTDHATYCDICLEVARDTKRLVASGKSLKEIRTYMDQTNGSKGPATKTPLPPS